MSASPTLDKLVVVSPRFARSVSLVRDAQRGDALEGYILTPTGRDVLLRLSDALRGDSATHAWSLTGPQCTVISASALFAAQSLSGNGEISNRAKKFLAACAADLSERFFGASGPVEAMLAGCLDELSRTALNGSTRRGGKVQAGT